jgi:hypothetical protein
MRINAVSARSTRAEDALAATADLDAYMTDRRVLRALINIERDHLPKTLLDPCAGTGNWLLEFRDAGYTMHARDIYDYGFPGTVIGDYLKAVPWPGVEGICTNPPFFLSKEFLEKALSEVGYVVFLQRTNWLESTKRLPMFKAHPPARVWISSRRLPTMHRHGWTGKQAASNICFAFYVWDAKADKGVTRLMWFDWKTLETV